MKRIVKIAGVGSVAFPDHMTDAEVSQVAGRFYDDANPTPPTPAMQKWIRVQFADNSVHEVHPQDVGEALRRNPGAKIVE